MAASSEVLVGVVVLTTPMLARSFLTDYVEWLVVSLGIIVVCECLGSEFRVWWDGEAAIEIERVVVESLEAGSHAVEK